MEEQHVGLLDDLRSGHALTTQECIGPRRPWCQLRDADGLQAMEAGELLVDAGPGVVTIDDVVRDTQPVGHFIGGRFTRRTPGPSVAGATARAPVSHGRRRSSEIPARHHVGVGIVVDELVVLVRPDHAPQVHAAVRVLFEARGPEAGRFDEQPSTVPSREGGVPAPGHVCGDGPGDIGDDVQLSLPGPDADRMSGRARHPGWCHVTTISCRLPREPGSPQASVPRGGLGSGQPLDAVGEHGAGGCRAGRREEGQHEDFRVPEDVALVRRSGEAAGSQRSLACHGDRTVEVEEGEVDRALQLIVAVDADAHLPPAARPRLAMLAQEACEPELLTAREVLLGGLDGRCPVGARDVRGQAVEPSYLAADLGRLGGGHSDPARRARDKVGLGSTPGLGVLPGVPAPTAGVIRGQD